MEQAVSLLLFLLLPVAAASGWYFARRGQRRADTRERNDFSAHYFKGLNYLLNEQPDKAIEVFIQMIEVDTETVEMHLALGNLFRRRGEVDRAIRIHQNIIARPTLNSGQRALALFELGQDYMRAGLLDRAEDLFQELLEIGDYEIQALRQLVEIYEQEKDWEKAIDTTRQLEELSGGELRGVVSHYYCELAEHALQDKDQARARDMVGQALHADQNCVRARILEAEMDRASGDCQAAIRSYKAVEGQSPEYISEIIEPLRQCSRQAGQLEELEGYLHHIMERYGGITPMLALAEVIRERHGERAASDFVVEQLRKRPSVRGLYRLIEFHLAHTEGAARENLLILNDLVKKLLDKRPFYKCNVCGFQGKTMHWHCPSCKRWNSVKPVQDVMV